MASDLLLEQMGLVVAEAADVARLNEAILQLAVQGKLTSPEPSDEPASVLLERMAAEKARLGIKGEKLPPIGDEERPFPLPNGWEWVRFGDATINCDSERIPLSREQRKTRQGNYDYYGASGVIDQIDDYIFDKPLLLIGEDGANLINRSTPIAFLAYGKYWVNNHAHVLDSLNLDMLKYLAVFINAIDLKPYITGTAQPKMNQSKMNSIVVPLPPLAEQKRIVERVENLLKQTRRLQTTLAEASATAVHLHQAAMHELLTAVDSTEFNGRWQFFADNFATLYDESCPDAALSNLAALKQAILQLAVQGKLTRQDPDDEPASVLLSRIAEEKKRLGIKSMELAEIGEGERPFVLPEGWEWVRFIDVANIASNLTKPELYPEFPHIAPNNIEKGSGRLLTYQTVAEDEVKSAKNHFFPGQIIYSKIRPNLSKAVIVDFEGLCSADMYPLDSFIHNRFLLLYILSETFLGFATSNDTRVAMPKINQTELNKIPVAVPPLAEQQRIVTRVQELLALCDQLAAQITASQQTRIALRDAVLGS